MAGDAQSAWIAAGASIIVSFVSLGAAAWTSIRARRTARDLAVLQHRLDEEQDAAKARRDYEYEARKRLYAELYPLAYQLQQAARHARHRIMNLALAARIGALAEGPDNWLTGRDPYYFTSVVHNLVAPLAIHELITRKLTLLDLTLDPDLQRQHLIAGRAYEALRSDFNLTDPRYPPIVFGSPAARYAPPEDPPAALPPEPEQRSACRQGLYSGQISQAVDAMLTTDGPTTRTTTYAEFAKALGGADLRTADEPWGQAGEMKRALRPVADIFRAFHPACRPVTWRILLAQAACYRALAAAETAGGTFANILRAARFAAAEDRAPFDWIGDGTRSIPAALRNHVDFAAEQESAFTAADLFLENVLKDLAD